MTRSRRMLPRIAAALAFGIGGVAAVVWLAFVPPSKETGYVFVGAWGIRGDGPGQFDDPTGLVVAGGEVFVADARNGRIQVFGPDGTFRRAFGETGKGVGQLGRPMNLTAHADELYVPEYFNDRIQVFGLDGTPRRVIGGPGAGPGEFDSPGGVAVGPDGHLFVADFYNHRIQELEPDGSFVRQWGTTGVPGSGAGEFTYPTDVALGANGMLYVADGYADRIQAFAPDGTFVAKWGGPFATNIHGPFRGWFAVPTSVAVGPEDNLFVADFYNDRIQKFASDGTFLTSFGEGGEGPGRLRHAMAVAAAPDGIVYVADFLGSRVQIWRSAD